MSDKKENLKIYAKCNYFLSLSFSLYAMPLLTKLPWFIVLLHLHLLSDATCVFKPLCSCFLAKDCHIVSNSYLLVFRSLPCRCMTSTFLHCSPYAEKTPKPFACVCQWILFMPDVVLTFELQLKIFWLLYQHIP